LGQTGGGLAAAAAVRLPTGNEMDLLGTGATQVKVLLVYSADMGRFAPHLNAGYTWSQGDLTQTLVRPSCVGFNAPAACDTVFRGQKDEGETPACPR
jgi:hypothetical protein